MVVGNDRRKRLDAIAVERMNVKEHCDKNWNRQQFPSGEQHVL